MTHDELIERLQAATGPFQELNVEIAGFIGWKYGFGTWSNPEGFTKSLPNFVGSIDAALTLVPSEANCHGYELDPVDGVEAHVSRNNVKSGHWLVLGLHPSSIAIALTIACLKARSRSSGREG